MTTIRDWFSSNDIPNVVRRKRKEIILSPATLNDLYSESQCKVCKGLKWCNQCDGQGQIYHYCDCPECFETHEDCTTCESKGTCPECDGVGHYQSQPFSIEISHKQKELIK
jgi:DnaJ-class molecular chaperone